MNISDGSLSITSKRAKIVIKESHTTLRFSGEPRQLDQESRLRRVRCKRFVRRRLCLFCRPRANSTDANTLDAINTLVKACFIRSWSFLLQESQFVLPHDKKTEEARAAERSERSARPPYRKPR